MGKRCVIYTRISRDDSGLGKANDRQEEMCRAKATWKEYEIVDVISDISVSAYSGKRRPGWQRVLEMVRAGEVDVVLAYHMDRITRSMRDLEEIIDLSVSTGVGIDTATGDIELTSDMGRMIARILAAVARQEVERKSQRQKLAYAQRAEDGLPHSVKTFGYTAGGLEVVEEEAAAIQEAAQDVLEGMTLTEITKRWVEEFPDRAPRTSTGVRFALLNPRYAGIRMYHGENMGIGQWPAILDMDMHLALRSLLEDPGRVHGKVRSQGRKPTTLLAGVAACQVCSEPTRATRAHGVFIYGCRGGNHINTVREAADKWVMAALCQRLSRPDFYETIVAGSDDDVEAARTTLQQLRQRKDQLAVMFATGDIDRDQMNAGSAELTYQMEKAEKILRKSRAMATPTLKGLSVGTPDVIDQVLALSLERQRALILAWLKVTFVPRGKGNRGKAIPIEEQVLIEAA